MFLIQNAFNGGEISPSCDSRQDTQQYAKSVKTMKNFYAKPQGAAVNRPGTYFIAAVYDSTKKVAIVPFVFSESIAYILEFGDYYVRFYRNNGQLSVSSADDWASGTTYAVNEYVTYNSLIYRCIAANTASSSLLPTDTTYWVQSAIYQIASPYAYADLEELKYTQSADVLYFANSDYKPKTLTRSGDTDWAFADFAFENGPFAPMNTTDTTITPTGTLTVDGSVTLQASSDTFYSGHVGGYFKLEQDVEAQSVASTFTNTTGYSDITSSKLNWSKANTDVTISVSLTVSGTFSATVTVYAYQHSTNSWSAILTETAAGTYTASYTSTSSYNYTAGSVYVAITGISSGTCTAVLSATCTNDSSTKSVTIKSGDTGTSDTVTGMGTWSFYTHGTSTGTLIVEKSTDGGSTWSTLRQYSIATDNVALSGEETEEMCTLRARCTSMSGTCYYNLEWEPYTAYGICKITAVSSTTKATATVTQAIGCTDATKYWYFGAWSDYRGWPTAVVFFQNRLWFGGTTKEPQTLWGSKSGDYTDYNTSFETQDDDAVTMPLVSDKVNAIKELKALSSKIIGLTAGAYWLAGAGDSSNIVTPSSMSASAEGYYGSTNLQAIMVGNRVLFVGSKGNTVRDMGFEVQSESYIASDITLLSEHLLRNRTITGWAYAAHPDGIVWCVCDDGKLLGLTYNREQNILAWHLHETDGEFESVAVIPTTTTDQVWFVVKRTVNGSTVRYVEKLMPRLTTPSETTNSKGETVYSYAASDQFFVDCGLTETSTTAFTTFEGLSHLEGKTVAILADGNVLPTQTVSSGKITIDNAAYTVHVGLPYTCDLETLNIEFQSQDGTVQTRQKKIKEINLRLENSRAFSYGASFTNMQRLKEKQEYYDVAIPLLSDDITKLKLCNNKSTTGRVCFRVTDPVPVCIQSVVAEVELT